MGLMGLSYSTEIIVTNLGKEISLGLDFLYTVLSGVK
jgi:hypothetical protein